MHGMTSYAIWFDQAGRAHSLDLLRGSTISMGGPARDPMEEIYSETLFRYSGALSQILMYAHNNIPIPKRFWML